MSEQNTSRVISFRDLDSGDEAIVIVRSLPGCVTLSLSLLSDGDLEVALPLDKTREVIEALQRAMENQER